MLFGITFLLYFLKLSAPKGLWLSEIINTLHKIQLMPIKMKKNISDVKEKALEELKLLVQSNIEIKKADKSDTWVIMDKTLYRDQLVLKEHLQTNTYEIASLDANKKVFVELGKLIEKHSQCLTKKEKNFILNKDWKDANFYVLPKINKCKDIVEKMKLADTEYLEIEMPKTLKSRPICGSPTAVTQGASKILDRILSPLVPKIKTYIKDEWDFVRKFPSKVEKSAILLSCDIVSLYTSIPIDLGIQALEYWIERLSFLIPSRFTKPFILELAKFVLSNNYFQFDSRMYHQIIGIFMGSIFAPPYACLTIGFLEETKLFPTLLPSKYNEEVCKYIIDQFFRFMDDGTTVLPFDLDENVFLELLNSMHPAIKYTIEKADRVTIEGSIISFSVIKTVY